MQSQRYYLARAAEMEDLALSASRTAHCHACITAARAFRYLAEKAGHRERSAFGGMEALREVVQRQYSIRAQHGSLGSEAAAN